MCDLPMLWKAVIVGLCNLIGVYVVKYFEEKQEKTNFGKLEVTLRPKHSQKVAEMLDKLEIPYNWVDVEKYVLFNIYCCYTERKHNGKRNCKQINPNVKYFCIRE